MTQEEFRDGYLQLQRELHEPEAYFDRLDLLYLFGDIHWAQPRAAYWRKHPWAWLCGKTGDVVKSIGIFVSLMVKVKNPMLRRVYRQRVLRELRMRPDPVVLFAYLLKCVIHHHHFTMDQRMTDQGIAIGKHFLIAPGGRNGISQHHRDCF